MNIPLLGAMSGFPNGNSPRGLISPQETRASCWLGSQISENVHGSEDLGIFDGALSRGGATGESHFHLLANAAEPWRLGICFQCEDQLE